MGLDIPFDVQVEMDSSYVDAAHKGALLLPMVIEVEVVNCPRDVPVEMDSSYDDAACRGALLLPLVIEVEVLNCPRDVPVEMDAISVDAQRRGDSISPQDEAFIPLSTEEEKMIKFHFSRDKSSILVEHMDSSIAITGNILSCLQPREWLNDDVINLYIALLKEREIREPEKHIKCHFFNTFFFDKLAKSGYNFEAVRKWTSMKKLGYHLKDCDKIFVPISMDLHWSLVVINIKDKKFQFLDSLKGSNYRSFIDALAKYYVDEVKDKNQLDIDISMWTQESVKDLPVQNNVFDCGMFVLKYMDFYSKGLDLCFTQDHMPYFRLRTAKEILQLKAE